MVDTQESGHGINWLASLIPLPKRILRASCWGRIWPHWHLTVQQRDDYIYERYVSTVESGQSLQCINPYTMFHNYLSLSSNLDFLNCCSAWQPQKHRQPKGGISDPCNSGQPCVRQTVYSRIPAEDYHIQLRKFGYCSPHPVHWLAYQLLAPIKVFISGRSFSSFLGCSMRSLLRNLVLFSWMEVQARGYRRYRWPSTHSIFP